MRARLERRIQSNCWAVCEEDVTHLLAAYDAATQARDAAEALLRDLLEPIEGQWVDEDHREQAAVLIRHTLGLCTSRGCSNSGGTDPETEGYCAECLEE